MAASTNRPLQVLQRVVRVALSRSAPANAAASTALHRMERRNINNVRSIRVIQCVLHFDLNASESMLSVGSRWSVNMLQSLFTCPSLDLI
jgi:hypothetical protein